MLKSSPASGTEEGQASGGMSKARIVLRLLSRRDVNKDLVGKEASGTSVHTVSGRYTPALPLCSRAPTCPLAWLQLTGALRASGVVRFVPSAVCAHMAISQTSRSEALTPIG